MITAARERAKKVDELAKRYNELIDKLPEDQRVPKIQKEDFKELGIGDKLWQIELFRSHEPWAFRPSIRRGIDALNLRSRSLEEVGMVAAEAERFFRSIVDRLSSIGRLLGTTNPEAFSFQQILHIGLKTSETLNQMTDLGEIGKGLQDIIKGLKHGDSELVRGNLEKLQGMLIPHF
jgi:hypothetical protein